MKVDFSNSGISVVLLKVIEIVNRSVRQLKPTTLHNLVHKLCFIPEEVYMQIVDPSTDCDFQMGIC